MGLDIALAAGKQLVPGAQPPPCLLGKVAQGHLGKKSGQGFYDWSSGKAQKARVAEVPTDLAQRLIQPLLEQTRQLVAQGIVADADLADAGVIFGTGFAPFRGGPMNYMNNST